MSNQSATLSKGILSPIQKMSVEALKPLLEEMGEDVIVLDLGQAQTYARGHIPKAVHLPVTRIVRQSGYASGLLPSDAALQALSDEFHLSSGKTIYIYDDEGGGWAGRMAWILDVLSVQNIVYIDGGLRAWMNAGYPLESEKNSPCAGQVSVVFDKQPNVTLDEMLLLLEQDQVDLLDARSLGEFNGTRQFAQKAGRIPGAVHFEWTDCLADASSFALKPFVELKEMLSELDIDGSKTIVTYCQTHHRSGLTYLMCRLLNLPVRAYAGSWSEWGNHPETLVENSVEASTAQ